MTADGIITMTVELMTSVVQSPAQGTDAQVARALQEVQAARQQALQEAQAARQQALQEAQAARQQAQQQAQAAQQEAQAAQREAQQEIERARREIDRAIRDARRDAGRAGREGQPEIPFPPPFPGGPQIPEGAVIMSVAFFVMCAVIAIGVPIARAIARRMDRRGAVAPGADVDTRARLERIEQAVDAIAVEVERISEGQRFTTKVISDLRALPQADASAGLAERGGERVAVPLSRARDGR